VTEDADLGIRLARLGYRSATIDSDTFEEACVLHGDWHRQRARWLKGFLQTWLVHMRARHLAWKQLGGRGFWVLQAVTIGVVVSALLHPLLLGFAVWHLAGIGGESYSLLSVSTWIEGFSLMILVAGYGASIWIAARTLRRQDLHDLWSSLPTLPVYWMLLTPAAWLALWQFLTDLHGWNKTPHGRSRLL
jgi:cellulose synthase/poly-beta-1,6-N-acetylglucosamine synthase-like glycosyltransferase